MRHDCITPEHLGNSIHPNNDNRQQLLRSHAAENPRHATTFASQAAQAYRGLWRTGVAGARLAGLLGDAGPLPVFSLPALGLGAALKKLAMDFWPLAGGPAPPLLLRLPAMPDCFPACQ